MITKFEHLIINVAHIEPRSLIYGPGERFVIWVQGCAIRCKGCWNKDMWSFDTKTLYSIEQLFELIKREKGVDGITILGGEPLHQSKSIFHLLRKVKGVGLSSFIYTGFKLDEIKDKWSKKVIQQTDILISGPYLEEKRSINLRWRGSSNQKISIRNNKYSFVKNFEEQNEIEIHLKETGEIIMLGYPSKEIKELIKNESGHI